MFIKEGLGFLLFLQTIMRLIKDIPHDRYKIQLLNYNAKYIIKIELGQYEQSFKIDETEIGSIEEIENMITPELLSNCLKRFIEMRSDWENAFLLRYKVN